MYLLFANHSHASLVASRLGRHPVTAHRSQEPSDVHGGVGGAGKVCGVPYFPVSGVREEAASEAFRCRPGQPGACRRHRRREHGRRTDARVRNLHVRARAIAIHHPPSTIPHLRRAA
jgi:hypothetical protein